MQYIREMTEEGFILQKLDDEGTDTKFVARLFVGVLELADSAIKDLINKGEDSQEFHDFKLIFDKKFDAVYSSLKTVRKNSIEIVSLFRDHVIKVRDDYTISGNTLNLPKNIDKELFEKVKNVLINSVIALKGVQYVTELFSVSIGFLFTKDVNFEKGIKELREKGDNELADYLYQVRKDWSESLILRRDTIEHEGWILPSVKYNRIMSGVVISEPSIDNIPITNYVIMMTNKLISFIENIIVYSFKRQIENGPFKGEAIIIEIPEDQKDTHIPKKRFKTYLNGFGIEEWTLNYGYEDFFNE